MPKTDPSNSGESSEVNLPHMVLAGDVGVQADGDRFTVHHGGGNGIPPCAGYHQRLAGRRRSRFLQVDFNAELVAFYFNGHGHDVSFRITLAITGRQKRRFALLLPVHVDGVVRLTGLG